MMGGRRLGGDLLEAHQLAESRPWPRGEPVPPEVGEQGVLARGRGRPLHALGLDHLP